jgi:hypothetical protein
MVVSESRRISVQGCREFEEMVGDCYISGSEVDVIGEGSLLLSEEVFHPLALAKISGAGSPGLLHPPTTVHNCNKHQS